MNKKKVTHLLAGILVFCIVIGLCVTGYAEEEISTPYIQKDFDMRDSITKENEREVLIEDNESEGSFFEDSISYTEEKNEGSMLESESDKEDDIPNVVDYKLAPSDDILSREPQDFPVDTFLESLSVTISDANGEHKIEYKEGDSTDFDMGEIQRNATLSIMLSFDPNKTAGNTDGTVNPIVYGDSFSCTVPDIISNANGGIWSGRLKDSTTSYGITNGSIGDFHIENGKLTITFDQGYIAETGGNIKNTSLIFDGNFDAYGWDETAFEKKLFFGNLPVTVHFPAENVLRNLSIDKTPVTYGPSEFSSSSYGVQGRSALNNTAKVDENGYITYSIKVSAAHDNSTFLDNVVISDVFTTDNVDPSSVVLLKAVKGSKDTDIMRDIVELVDDNGHITGWNVGRLNRGEEATVTFKIKIDKDKITAAVDAIKGANPDSSAEEARLIKNTATANADKLANPVKDDAVTLVQNYITAYKYKDGNYDPNTHRQKFRIVISAPSNNKYTLHNIYFKDEQDSYGKWFDDAGILGISIKHADGSVTISTADNPLYNNFTAGSYANWSAFLNELAPGDTATINTYVEINPNYFYNEEGSSSSGTNGLSNVYNKIYAGNGDLKQCYDYVSYYINKQWISKSGSYSSEDGTITWTMIGNAYDSDLPDADITGLTVKDILDSNQTMLDQEVLVTFYEPNSTKVREYTGLNSRNGRMVVSTTEKGFSFEIPSGFGNCKFTVTYKTKVENNYGPASYYSNTGKLGIWSCSASTYRPRIASIEKQYVERGADWAKWCVKILGPVNSGDVLTDTLTNSPSVIWFDEDDINNIEVTFNGKTIDKSLYNIVPTVSSKEGKSKGFTLTFLGSVSDTGPDGKEITPTSQNPAILTYKTHLAYQTYNYQTQYDNSISLVVDGKTVDTSNACFYRSNYPEISKKYNKTVGSDITWTVRVNRSGYGCYPIDENKNPVYYKNNGKGEKSGYYSIITETVPAGLKYITAKYGNSKGSNASIPTIEELGRTDNEDGSLTVKLLIGNLLHYEGDSTNSITYRNSNGYYYVDIDIVTQIVDKECLLDTTEKNYEWNNKVSLTSMDGQTYEANAAMNIAHKALTKEMKYDGTTAPNALFTIDMNMDEFDLDPDSDTIKVFDKSSNSLTVDTSSIKVIDTRDNSRVDFILDAGDMATDGTFSLEVPDNMPLRITYSAGISGVKGDEVRVSNNVYFEGQTIEEVTSSINQIVTVLNASAQAQSDVMIWLKKMDATAKILPGCIFKLEKYTAGEGWVVVNDNIITSDDSEYATKVGGLEKDILYRLTETKAADNYILDEKPHYFCLKVSQDSEIIMPKDFNEDVFYCGVASLISAYNKPYVPVTFRKINGSGDPLPGAEFKVVDSEGNTVKDKDGHEIVFTTKEEPMMPQIPPAPPVSPEVEMEVASIINDGNLPGLDNAQNLPTFYMEPGKYTLVEVVPPSGYLPADPIIFTANTDKTVSVGNNRVENNIVVCLDSPTSVTIRKMDGSVVPATAVSGAVLQILDGTTVKEEWVTDGRDHTITGVLDINKNYTLHEKEAPEGFLLADDISFSVKEDGTIESMATQDDGTSVVDDSGVLTMVDKKPSLDIVKVNNKKHTDIEEGAPLSGVSLTMTLDDTEIRSWTTTVTSDDPVSAVAEHFDNLEAGKKYTVTENYAPSGYVVPDPFTFIPNADGTYTVTGENASYEDGVLTIKNNYVPTPVDVELTVHKQITGLPASDKIFTFELWDDDNNIKTTNITGAGESSFEKITFIEAGIYNYTIKERVGTDKGYTYEEASHSVIIKISDDGLGTLSKEVIIDGYETEELTINNTYAPLPVKMPLFIKKAFSTDSADRPTVEDFTFIIEGKAGNEPLPERTSVTANEKAEGLFGDILYTEEGIYEYVITEIDDGKTGYTYADPITIKIIVEDMDGQLEASLLIDDREQENIVFINSYKDSEKPAKETPDSDNGIKPELTAQTGDNRTEMPLNLLFASGIAIVLLLICGYKRKRL